MSEALRNNPDSIESSKTQVRPEWFKAYYEGNSRIPQANEGITIYVVNEVFSEKSVNPYDFAQSTLSDDQVTFIGEMMDRMHKAKNINVATNGVRKVTPERMRLLWSSVTGEVLRHINKYILFVEGTSLKDDFVGKLKPEDFFSVFDSNEKIRWYKDGMKLIKQALDNQDIQELLKNYRDSFKDPQKRRGDLWSDYEPMFRKYLHVHVDGSVENVPQEVCEYLIENLVCDK